MRKEIQSKNETFQFPSLDIQSTSPTGERVDNLKHTRIRSKNKDHILLFKVSDGNSVKESLKVLFVSNSIF